MPPPSVLVGQLLRGELDIAMASTFAVLQYPELHLLDGIGVTCRGPAWSVRLLSTTPPAKISRLALDLNSRSTVAMARIVLADRYGAFPVCFDMQPNPSKMLERADAAVIIGDIGMSASAENLLDYDLGSEWFELTGMPFYFAGWIARDREVLTRAAPVLYQALEKGLEQLPRIAARESERLKQPFERCYRYLSEIMRYHVGPIEQLALEEFRKRAKHHTLIEASCPGVHTRSPSKPERYPALPA